MAVAVEGAETEVTVVAAAAPYGSGQSAATRNGHSTVRTVAMDASDRGNKMARTAAGGTAAVTTGEGEGGARGRFIPVVRGS